MKLLQQLLLESGSVDLTKYIIAAQLTDANPDFATGRADMMIEWLRERLAEYNLSDLHDDDDAKELLDREQKSHEPKWVTLFKSGDFEEAINLAERAAANYFGLYLKIKPDDKIIEM